MNIFVTHPDPRISAQVLPDKHVVKMPLECCQMLAIIYSGWYYDWEPLPKKDGGYYATAKGAFRNHPCTKWAGKNVYNTAWLIQHGCCLSSEYEHRYGKQHSCAATLFHAKKFSIDVLEKQSCAIVWRKSSQGQCPMCTSLTKPSQPMMHTNNTLHQNPG